MRNMLFLIVIFSFCSLTIDAQVFKTAKGHAFGTGVNSPDHLADELEGGNVNGVLKARSISVTVGGVDYQLNEVDLFCILMIGIYNDLYVPLVPGTKPLNFEIHSYGEFYAVLRNVAEEGPANWKPGDDFRVSYWEDGNEATQWMKRDVNPNEIAIILPIPGQSRENWFRWCNKNTCVNPYEDNVKRSSGSNFSSTTSTTYQIPPGTGSITINNNNTFSPTITIGDVSGGSVSNAGNSEWGASPFSNYNPNTVTPAPNTTTSTNTTCNGNHGGCNHTCTNTQQVVDNSGSDAQWETAHWTKKNYQANSAGAAGAFLGPILGAFTYWGLSQIPMGGGQTNTGFNNSTWQPTDWGN